MPANMAGLTHNDWSSPAARQNTTQTQLFVFRRYLFSEMLLPFPTQGKRSLAL